MMIMRGQNILPEKKNWLIDEAQINPVILIRADIVKNFALRRMR